MVCRSTEEKQSVQQIQDKIEEHTTLLHVATCTACPGIYVELVAKDVKLQLIVYTPSSVSDITENNYIKHYQATTLLTRL